MNELNKLDFKVCDKLNKYLRKIESHEDEEDDDDYGDDEG
jgi:hypothetical protein